MFFDLTKDPDNFDYKEGIKTLMMAIGIITHLEKEIGHETLEKRKIILQVQPGTKELLAFGSEFVGGIEIPQDFSVLLDRNVFIGFSDKTGILMVYGTSEKDPAAFVYWIDAMFPIYIKDVEPIELFRPQLHIFQN